MEKLSISFWIWALQDIPPGGCYHDLDRRIRELKERNFNCIRCESGAGLAFDLNGNPRGAIEVLEPYPGFSRKIRQQFAVGDHGKCDYRTRLLELFAAAKRHQVKIILTSFYYLHTYWHTEEAINDELFAIPPHERFRRFAEFLDRVIAELKKHDLISPLAFAEIFNEYDGLPFVGGYGNVMNTSGAERALFRQEHEDALAWLMDRHPDIRFAADTYTPFTDVNLLPRNARIWNFHAYYMWPVYDLLEQGFVSHTPGPNRPDDKFIDSRVSLEDIRNSRSGRRPTAEDWYRRVWLYANLRPENLPELESLLTEELQLKEELYKSRAREALGKALEIRDLYLPSAELVMAEGATYCGAEIMEWEEKSDSYWRVIDYAAEIFSRAGVVGFAPRTNSGCDESSWPKAADRVRQANRIFRG